MFRKFHQKTLERLLIRCAEVSEIKIAVEFFLANGYTLHWNLEHFTDYFYVGSTQQNEENLISSFPTQNAAQAYYKDKGKIPLIVTLQDLYIEVLQVPVEKNIEPKEETIKNMISFLRSKKALNPDCACQLKAEMVRKMDRIYFEKEAEGIFGEFQHKYYLKDEKERNKEKNKEKNKKIENKKTEIDYLRDFAPKVTNPEKSFLCEPESWFEPLLATSNIIKT